MWISLQSSFVFDWRISTQDRLQHFYVEKGADTPTAVGTHQVDFDQNYRWEGKSSTYANPGPGGPREIIPYFLVQQADKNQSGFYVGIEFSGRTHLTLQREQRSLRGELGLNPLPGPFRTRLTPSGSFVTPKIFLGAAVGGPDAVANVLRPWVREVLGSKETWNDPHYPLTVINTWGGGMAVNEEVARRMLRDAAGLGLEMFHIDAGWFRGVGDWHPDPQKFPRGLAPIADEAHSLGLKFGLWVDWTQAALGTNPGALNVRDPSVLPWLTSEVPADWRPEEFKGHTIDIGFPPAKAWALQETDRIVSDYKLDMLEHDGYLVAQGCASSSHPHTPPDLQNKCQYGNAVACGSNATDVSYHAVRAYYDVQSNLRAKHAGIILEVCNDGGRMVDFGTAAHADYFSITDTYDPISNRRAFYDTSYVLPAAMLETYVEHWPVSRIENFRYMLRSGMMGWFTIMMDTSAWSAEQHAVAKSEIDFYKSTLRPLIRDAILYHISERPDGVRWDGMEYFDSASDKGVVFAFRGTDPKIAEHVFHLKGLRPKGRYQLLFRDHTSRDSVVTGAQLMNDGIAVRLQESNSSEIVSLLPMHSR
ncbi:MAG: alpha-galactosidase [Acidobacteria bacterium]|nr:alpha-galactosidase [Acidobacteriota bacterium]